MDFPPPPSHTVVEKSSAGNPAATLEEWSPAHVGHDKTVVFVDDRSDILELYSMLLQSAFGCKVIAHTDPLKALDDVRILSKKNPDTVLLITDDALDTNAAITGRKLIEAIHDEQLPAEVILFSGNEKHLLEAQKRGIRVARKMNPTEDDENRVHRNMMNFSTAVHHAFSCEYARKTGKPLPKQIADVENYRHAIFEREQQALQKEVSAAIHRHRDAPWSNVHTDDGAGLASYHAHDTDYMNELKRAAAERDTTHSEPLPLATARSSENLVPPRVANNRIHGPGLTWGERTHPPLTPEESPPLKRP